MSNPRTSNGSKRRGLRKRVASEGLPCHLCGYPIDYQAGHLKPTAYELDEIVPVSRGGSATDPDNVAPAHRCCNQWRSDRKLTKELKREIRARFERDVLGMRRSPARPDDSAAYRTSRRWIPGEGTPTHRPGYPGGIGPK